MVEPREIFDALEAGITAATPDGRYALEGETFRPSWVASPDQESDNISPRDLLFQILLGDCQVDGDSDIHDLAVVVVLTRYKGKRTSYLSGHDMSAAVRVHGACKHMLELVPAIPVPGCCISAVGYDRPIPAQPPDYLVSTVYFQLVAT